MAGSAEKRDARPLSVVGTSVRKVDGLSKCAGLVKFADDIVLPRMIVCKIHRAPVPHARIRRIDTARASAMPGVLAVLTGAEMPIPFGILPVSQDEHALCTDRVRFVGDPVAAVAAVDEDVAFDAMNAIEVEYEPLEPVMSIDQAIAGSAPSLHDYGDAGSPRKAKSSTTRPGPTTSSCARTPRACSTSAGSMPTAAGAGSTWPGTR